ncbi:MAG: hypothetical protein OES79_07305 [Planctomycetota bacterium]|nr:hypothetical protein [Planctomycetota bacterium]
MTVNNFHVYIFRVPRDDGSFPPHDYRHSSAASDEVDPYIAELIARLQREVRDERRLPRAERWRTKPRWTFPIGEAPPPLTESPLDFDVPDRNENWPLLGDTELEDSDF